MIVIVVYIADNDDFVAHFVVYMLFYIYKSTDLMETDLDIQSRICCKLLIEFDLYLAE